MVNKNGEYESLEEALNNEPSDEKVRWASEIEGEKAPPSIGQDVSGIETILSKNPSFLEKSKKSFTRLRNTRGGGFNVSLSALKNSLGNLDQRALLEVLSRVSIAQFAAQLDIANSVDSFSNITVSGSNDISNADVPEVVVPRSDSEDIPTRSLYIQADPGNSELIYFGDDAVEPNSGFALSPGDSFTLGMDLRQDQLYMASSESGQQVNLLGVV